MSSDLWFEEPDDELDDDEYLDEDSDEANCTVSCPECGAEVYEDAVRCPVCGNYITHHGHIWSGRPSWWILLGLLGIISAILVLGGIYPW